MKSKFNLDFISSASTTLGIACIQLFIQYLWIRASQYDSVETTNKMQSCNRIYNMYRTSRIIDLYSVD
jgi:hypothetical protein